MAGKRKIDGDGDSEGFGVPPLHRIGGADRRGHRPVQIREDVRPRNVGADSHGSSDHGEAVEGRSPMGVAPESGVKDLWMPQSGSDLSIYKQMLRLGAIKPYEMPQGMERLAHHVMGMMEMAQASGRMRDAIKCVEILRMLQADNRAMAVEMDKIERLDAGKPTTITGQVSPEVADRIKRIVSTQRSRSVPANTEDTNVGSTSEDGTARPDSSAGRD